MIRINTMVIIFMLCSISVYAQQDVQERCVDIPIEIEVNGKTLKLFNHKLKPGEDAVTYCFRASPTCCSPQRMIDGAGQVVTERRPIRHFNGVSLTTIGTLHIEQGATQALHIKAEENLLPYIETEVVGGILEIGHKYDVRLNPQQDMHFYVTVEKLEQIEIIGNGHIRASNLHTMGKLTVKISGSGKVSVSGHIPVQDISINGSGHYKACNLASDEVVVQIKGSGQAAVLVRHHLEVTIDGSGSVHYMGQPILGKLRRAGSGRIQQVLECS